MAFQVFRLLLAMEFSVSTWASRNRIRSQSQKCSLKQARCSHSHATIESPISGVVISRSVDVGQTVAASLSAPTIFTIANDLKKMQVQASVDEADIGSVKVGQNVSFRVDSYPDDTFEGKVSQVRLAPVITQNVVNYTVIIDVANPEMKLMPGMTATVSIEVAKRENVLRVPIQAIRFAPPDEQKENSGRGAEEGRSAREGTDSARGSLSRGSGQDSARGERMNMRMRRSRAASDSGRGEWKSAAGTTFPARVWVVENGKPKSLGIVRGLMNTQYVEVVRGDLKEGDQVIIGSVGGQTQVASGGQNPFQPRIGGGPGGGGRRF